MPCWPSSCFNGSRANGPGTILHLERIPLSHDFVLDQGPQPTKVGDMDELVVQSRARDIGIITINNPPVNALSPGVPEGIITALGSLQKDAAITGIVLIGGGRTFIPGADIKEFERITSGQKQRNAGLTPLLQALEECAKPVVCAIHGTAFGGGLETAMACHYRVAVASAQVGQPEVKLGLIPGAGGTQRLPRLAGVARAAEMCTMGEPVPAAEALQAGIQDQIVAGDLLEGAIAFARALAARGEPPRKTRDLTEKLNDPKANAQALHEARAMIKQRARGLFAPPKALDAIEAATRLPFEEGLRKEGNLYDQALATPEGVRRMQQFLARGGQTRSGAVSYDWLVGALAG